MALTTDLYSILKAYANKNNSPYIKMDPFLDFLEKYAVRMAKKQGEWAKWTKDTGSQFWKEIAACSGDGSCILMTEDAEKRVFLPFFYADKIQEAYDAFDVIADIPFPTENSLKIAIPKEQLELIHLETDLVSYFDRPAESPLPILKVQLPDIELGSILVLAPMLPRRLLETSILKVRQYLLPKGNKEHAVHRLTPQLSGNEDYVREVINQIVIKPMESVNTMESYGDSAFLFWSYFCAMIKDEVKKQREKLAQDIAVLEAAYVIDICNTLYKIRIQQEKEKEAAFQSLDQRMAQSPYYYSLSAIIKFTNKKGTVLLGIYSETELEAHIRKKTTESMNNEVPDWLIIQGEGDEKWFIQKDKYLLLADNMLINVRSQVKKEITDRWIKVLREFDHEEAMDSDTEFNRLLAAAIGSAMPILMPILRDNKLFLVYQELMRSQEPVPSSFQIFDNGRLLPLSRLLQMKRHDLLLDARFSLPFWYSTPILTPIIAFFMTFGKKKKPKKKALKGQKKANIDEEEQSAAQGESVGDLEKDAREIAALLVPQGRSLDDYLEVMADRWGGVLKDTGREHLVEDVNTLARDNLRRSIPLWKNIKVTQETLGNAADRIISGAPILNDLRDKNALKLYMELYMVKQILSDN
jgi:hypothetical protein